MSGETVITLIGNLTNDPELRFTPSGSAVANFTVASTPRTFDRQSNEWKDAETLFLRCSAWRELAENIAESITKGTRVIVTGKLGSRSYEDKQGEKRTVIELEVEELGTSLRYATAKVTRSQRGNQQGGQQGQWNGQQQAQPPAQQGQYAPQQGGYVQQGAPQQGGYAPQPGAQPPVQQDPWGGAPAQNPGQWGNGPDNQPPF
jgi:single-strand DNA-binding protein